MHVQNLYSQAEQLTLLHDIWIHSIKASETNFAVIFAAVIMTISNTTLARIEMKGMTLFGFYSLKHPQHL